MVAALNKAVETVVALSKEHKGALQYMQGCGLMVSFNTASRVAAHESKACSFAVGLKAALEELPGAPFAAHVSVVTTNVLAFFAGNKGQLVLTVLGGYMPIHTAMHRFMSDTVGDDVSCLVTSSGTLVNVEHQFESRVVGVVQLDGREGCATEAAGMDVYEVVRAHSSKADDEWMYELENQHNPHLLTKQVVEAAAGGDYERAKELLKHCDPDDAILQKCLFQRVARCDSSPIEFKHLISPTTKMW